MLSLKNIGQEQWCYLKNRMCPEELYDKCTPSNGCELAMWESGRTKYCPYCNHMLTNGKCPLGEHCEKHFAKK